VVELPGRDFPVLRNVSVEIKWQIFMLFVDDPEAFYAGMIHVFEFGSCKTLALYQQRRKQYG
jgi:hypothetical protein